MKQFPAFMAVLLTALTTPLAAEVDRAVLDAEAARVDVVDRAKDSVLAVFSADGKGGGSGVVISADGYALTNFHVARPCGNAMKCGMADGRIYDTVIVGMDPTGDVALIKLFGRDDFPCAPLGDSDEVRVGDWVYVMGNPFMLATDFLPTVTYGIVSGVHRYQYPAGTLLEYADCIQTDASINPGNSGGPLFDAAGRLIGINGRGSFEKRGRVNVGVGYAVSINQIKHFLGYLHSGRIVDHATVDARTGFDEDGRVVVVDLIEGSDAYRRGLRYDDEIVSFGGRPVSTPNGFKNVLGIYPKGWRVPLSFRRDGRRRDVLVRLSGVHSPSELIEKATERSSRPPMPIPDEDEDSGDERGRGDRGRNGSEGPGPMPMPGDRRSPSEPDAEQPMPDVVREHSEARRGYANYYFNRFHRDRVWQAWADVSRFGGASPAWTMAGPLEGGGTFRFVVDDQRAEIELPAGRFPWAPTDALGFKPEPPGSGGLLPSLYFWRRLACQGVDGYGDVYYLGTAPLAGHEGLAEVLVGVHAGAECRFFFDPDDGRLLAMEMFPEEDVDPCEVFFRDYRPLEERLLPGRLEVRHGDTPYGDFAVERFEFNPKKAQP